MSTSIGWEADWWFMDMYFVKSTKFGLKWLRKSGGLLILRNIASYLSNERYLKRGGKMDTLRLRVHSSVLEGVEAQYKMWPSVD